MKNVVKLLLFSSILVAFVVFSVGGLFDDPYTATATQYSLSKGLEIDVAPQCSTGLVYDDGTFENGYGWNVGYGIGKFVLKMTPATYPYTINQICFSLTRTAAGSANWTFGIEIYDTTGTGGGPGVLVWSLPNQVASNVPIWPLLGWFDFTVSAVPALQLGSYYVGISWDPNTMPNHFVGADQSTTTPLRPGYGYIQNAWATIQSYGGPFANYRCMGIRVEGTGQTFAHDIGAGPFLSMPTLFNAGTQYPIKAKITNFGTSNETGIPIKFFVNGTQVNSTTINLNTGTSDSVSFNWTPADSGNFNLAIAAALSTDQYRANDTVKTTVKVWPPGTVFNCIGTGTTAIGHPFYTFYMDSRTDMLYLGSELGFGMAYIKRIGFNVTFAAPQVMNGFKIKMQNTALTTISSFTSSGWTTVYDAPYTVPGTGWRYIDLTGAGFLYNGTNLLVEICFNNSSYTSNSTVYGSTASGRNVHAHNDLPSGDGCVDLTTPGSTYTQLPNICVLAIVGTNNQGSTEIPKVFSLSQNYPNPFNPTTVIQFGLPKQSHVMLVIYDALGREVATLINDELKAGTYSQSFDASYLSSGVYFYKINAGDFTDTKKMLLVK